MILVELCTIHFLEESWNILRPTSVMAHVVNENGACPDRHHGEEIQIVNDDGLSFAVLAQLTL